MVRTMFRPARAAGVLVLTFVVAACSAPPSAQAPTASPAGPTPQPTSGLPTPLIVDTDLSVDDIIALAYVLRQPTLDVRASAIDVLACGGQKWLLSPWGTGFAYVRRELVTQLEPPAAGWISVRGAEDFGRLTDYELAWRDDARRFEVGTLPHQDYVALDESVGLLLELDAG